MANVETITITLTPELAKSVGLAVKSGWRATKRPAMAKPWPDVSSRDIR